MSIKSVYGLAVAGIVLVSCQSDFYLIKGFARQLQEGDTICLAFGEPSERILDKTIVSDGQFTFSGNTDTTLFCRAYLQSNPTCTVSFFLEPGNIAMEINLPPKSSRVSGTRLNNNWQQLNDSIKLIGAQLIKLSKETGFTDESCNRSRFRAIDSLHRKMSACIIHTARRNNDNALGRYIDINYKEPKFK